MNKKILGIVVVLLAAAMLATSIGGVLARPFYKDISLEKTYSMIFIEDHPELLVIDIRPPTGSPFAYDQGHIPGAINVPSATLSAWITGEGLNHLNDKIIVNCYLGIGSPGAAQTLIDAGFKKVYSMDGGYNAWVAAGYPTTPPV